MMSSDSTIALSPFESRTFIIVAWRCASWQEGVSVVAGVSDFLAGAGAQFPFLVWAIVWTVPAAVLTAGTASWYSLFNLFHIQELVMWPSLLQYTHDLTLEHYLLLVWEDQ